VTENKLGALIVLKTGSKGGLWNAVLH